MKEILLCKYGEIILKGANRRTFEDVLCKTLRFRARHFGKFTVTRSQSTIVIEPEDETADMDGMFETALRVFGIEQDGTHEWVYYHKIKVTRECKHCGYQVWHTEVRKEA